jgi:uncharacterized protein
VGVIVILTKKNISRIRDLYTFFRENKINVKINPLVKSGQARKNYDGLSISSVEYGKAMIQLFDLWFFEKEYDISINPLDLIIGNMITEIPFGCNFSESCQNNFISIGPLGDVYPCGRFDGVDSFKFGNINKNSLDTILASDVRQRLLARTSETINGCNSCEFRTICNAGCMHSAYVMGGDEMQKDYYCPSYKMLFKHIKKALDAEIKGSLGIRKLAIKSDTQRCIVKIFGHKLVLDNIENPQLRKIVRQRCKAASLEFCIQGGENYADHYDWNEYAEHGDAYNDYSDNHVDTTYSDHNDGYFD